MGEGEITYARIAALPRPRAAWERGFGGIGANLSTFFMKRFVFFVFEVNHKDVYPAKGTLLTMSPNYSYP